MATFEVFASVRNQIEIPNQIARLKVDYNSFVGTDYNKEKTPPEWTNWSIWQQDGCFYGIWIRHRSHSTDIKGKDYVQIEIRNDYNKGISINTRLTNNENDLTIYRIEIPAGSTYTSGSTEGYLNSGERFYFLMDKMHFDGDGYGPYRKCDK